MTIAKQSIGIDISKSSFTACLCQRAQSRELTFSKLLTFKMIERVNQLLHWVKSVSVVGPELVFSWKLPVFITNRWRIICISSKRPCMWCCLTLRSFSSLNIKTKTDKVDARVLSQFGAERRHRNWTPPSPVLRELRNLTRYYVQLQEQKTALGNIKHSKDCSHDVQSFILKSNQKLIGQIDKQISECKKAIGKLILSDPDLKEKVRN